MSAPAPKTTGRGRLALTIVALAKECPAYVDDATWLAASLARRRALQCPMGQPSRGARLDGPRPVRLGGHTRQTASGVSAALPLR